jgi:hypothetical protein
MPTTLQVSILLRIAILVLGVVAEHDELHEDSYLERESHVAHGHSHGDQLPLGYVKYPWQSPQTHVTYPGDDEGRHFAGSTIDAVYSLHSCSNCRLCLQWHYNLCASALAEMLVIDCVLGTVAI